MEENKPLLNDEDEKIMINTENSTDLSELKDAEESREETESKEDVSESASESNEESKMEESSELEEAKLDNSDVDETVDLKEKAENKETGEISKPEDEYVVPETYKKEVIAPTEAEKQKINEEKREEASPKKNRISLIVTLVLTALVAYLLVKTCIGFYYGFKYKDYVPEDTKTTEQPKI